MRKYVFISVGGCLGAMLRYAIRSVPIHTLGSFPLNTFLINIAGSFLLAVVLTAALELKGFDPDIKLGIGTGFLGAFTTFSTLCKETVVLFDQGDVLTAASYCVLSVFVGLFAAFLGVALTKMVLSKRPDAWAKEK
jgi:CrcB protein